MNNGSVLRNNMNKTLSEALKACALSRLTTDMRLVFTSKPFLLLEENEKGKTYVGGSKEELISVFIPKMPRQDTEVGNLSIQMANMVV